MRLLLLTGGRRKVIIIVKSHSKIIALHITIVLLTAKFLLMMLYYTLKIAASQSFFEKILKNFCKKGLFSEWNVVITTVFHLTAIKICARPRKMTLSVIDGDAAIAVVKTGACERRLGYKVALFLARTDACPSAVGRERNSCGGRRFYMQLLALRPHFIYFGT